jgi:hypothetical protein
VQGAADEKRQQELTKGLEMTRTFNARVDEARKKREAVPAPEAAVLEAKMKAAEEKRTELAEQARAKAAATEIRVNKVREAAKKQKEALLELEGRLRDRLDSAESRMVLEAEAKARAFNERIADAQRRREEQQANAAETNSAALEERLRGAEERHATLLEETRRRAQQEVQAAKHRAAKVRQRQRAAAAAARAAIEEKQTEAAERRRLSLSPRKPAHRVQRPLRVGSAEGDWELVDPADVK